MASQLSVLIASKKFATSAGEITLSPFKFKQLNEALALVDKYMNILANRELDDIGMVQAFLQKQDEGYLVQDDIAKLITLVSGVEDLGDFGYDEIIGLFTEIISMNMDFFTAITKKFSKEKAEKSESPKAGESESAA